MSSQAGRLSADTVATLAAVGTPENEAALIETATVATGAQLQRLGTQLQAEHGPHRARG